MQQSHVYKSRVIKKIGLHSKCVAYIISALNREFAITEFVIKKVYLKLPFVTLTVSCLFSGKISLLIFPAKTIYFMIIKVCKYMYWSRKWVLNVINNTCVVDNN